MGPAVSADRRSQVQSTRSIVGAPESASSQLRGFTTSTMNPMMTVGQVSQLRPTSGQNRAPEAASSLLRGFTTSPSGADICPTGSSTPCRSSPSVRTIPHCSELRPTPVGAVDRLAKGSALVFVVVDDDIWPGHSPNEPTTSPASASSLGSTVTSSRRWNRTRRNNGEPGGLKVQEPPGTRVTLTMRVHDRGSKMVKQVPCLRRRCRWPLTGPVPEVSSWSLRWASRSVRWPTGRRRLRHRYARRGWPR